MSSHSLPTQSCTLWPSRQAAVSCPRGEMSLALCEDCGLLLNTTFDANILTYDAEYENALHYSPLFRGYSTQLAVDLVERYDLRHKTVLEIGCGKGDFLKLLVDLGDNRGIGFDPAYERDPDEPTDDRITFAKDYYTHTSVDTEADLVIARQLLEHIEDPLEFLRGIRGTMADWEDAVLVVEVPNALDMLQRLDIWNVIYEHPIYFTPQALESALRSSGFAVHAVRPAFEDQYLVAEASVDDHTIAAAEDLAIDLQEVVERFATGYADRVKRWRARLDDIRELGQRAVLWGAGARGNTFLNVVETGSEISMAVDINPRKWGKHMAGTGQPIRNPEALRENPPDVVVIANEVYRDEISARLNEMGIAAEIVVA